MKRLVYAVVAAAGAFVGVAGLPSATASPAALDPPPAGAPTCGDTQIPKSTGGYWTCTFDDEFDGTTLDSSKWTVQTTAASAFTTGPACFKDSPDNISVANGWLSLTARKEAEPFTCSDPEGDFTTQYTSGSVMTYGKFSQTYGRFEARAKFPASTIEGLQETLWLWPVDPTKFGAWPRSGEIDWAELYSRYADRSIPYVHYNPAAYDPNVTNDYCLINDISQPHTYTVEWTPTTITVSYDGNTCLVDDWDPASPLVKPQPFDEPFMIALTQGLGVSGNDFDPATTPLPATTQIDYVRAWS